MQRTVLAVALLLFSLVLQPALAQQKAAIQKPPALDQLDCRTLLKLDGDERAYTLVYFHGFISGKLAQLDLPTEAMAMATDRIIDHCISKPGDKVLVVFDQVRNRK